MALPSWLVSAAAGTPQNFVRFWVLWATETHTHDPSRNPGYPPDHPAIARAITTLWISFVPS